MREKLSRAPRGSIRFRGKRRPNSCETGRFASTPDDVWKEVGHYSYETSWIRCKLHRVIARKLFNTLKQNQTLKRKTQ